MNWQATRKAFTLVELLVVIGIIAILVGILLPALTKAKQQAQEAQCESNLRQWGIGVASYIDQYGGSLPYKGPDGTSPPGFAPANGVIGFDDPSLWFNAIPPYVGGKSYYNLLLLDFENHGLNPAPHYGDNSIFMCPCATGPLFFNGDGNDLPDPNYPGYYILYGQDSTNTIRSGLRSTGFFPFDLVYVWNSKMLSPIVGTSPDYIKVQAIKQSSQVPMMVEKIGNYGDYTDKSVQLWSNENPTVYSNAGGAQHQGWITSSGLTGTNVCQSKSDWTRFAVSHFGGGNILFVDGHVAWFKWSQVQYGPSQLPWENSSDANINLAQITWCTLGPTD
jgi:prepilin-type N-terminal cleavage/methylation domain-containing protein/prepilin-type processing-associated H-X9-DG protein